MREKVDRIKSLVGDGLVSTWEHTGYSEGSGVGCGGCRGLVPGTGAAAWWGLRRAELPSGQVVLESLDLQ